MNKILRTMAQAAGVWAGSSYAAVRIAYNQMFGRSKLLKYSMDYRYADYERLYPGKYGRRKVQIPDDGYELTGYIYGEDTGKGLIIVSHGIFAGQECYISIILKLVDRGYMVLGFDNTGCCESPGDGIGGLPQGPLDLMCALRFVENDPELKDMPRFLFGHSWGGYSVTAVLNYVNNVDGVISISGFDTPTEVTMEMGSSMLSKAVMITMPMIVLENRRRFGEYANISAVQGINSCGIPVMVMHGTGDTYVRYDGSGIINHADEITNPNVSIVPLDYPGRNGHDDIFLSAEAKEYINELNEKLEAPKKEYGVKRYWQLPEEVQEEFFRNVDKTVSAQVNMDLVDKIDAFYTGILNKEL